MQLKIVHPSGLVETRQLSRRENGYVNEALTASLSSNLLHNHHGAVIVGGGRTRSRGYNHDRMFKNRKFIGSMHAESCAILAVRGRHRLLRESAVCC